MKRPPIVFSYEEIKRLILAIDDKQDQFLFATSYANGTRIHEIIGIKAGDISWTDEFVYITTPVLKKRGNIPLRAPPIIRTKEAWLANIIIDFVQEKTGKLIHLSVRTAQRRFDKYFNCTSHSFRHTRATHCFTVLKMSSRMVAEYFRLSPRGMGQWVMTYGHLDRGDMEEHLKGVK